MVSARTMPTWLLSHGSPMSLYEPGHPAYRHWVAIGKEIRQLKPRGIVIVSAHWQADGRKTLSPDGTVEVDMNTNTSNPLIYDFYNFPKHYYDAQFHSGNPAELQQLISQQLTANGIHVRPTDRGIDHGVWVPLKSAFGETLEIPLTQISLPIERSPKVDAEASLRLGAALGALRAQDIVVIGSGQTVHNLRDFFGGKDGGYSDTFPLALYDAIQQHADQERRQKALSLFDRPDYRSAHPTQEHLLREYRHNLDSKRSL